MKHILLYSLAYFCTALHTYAQVFTDQIATSGLPTTGGNVSAIYDHDNDGRLDIVWYSESPSQYQLMRNNGDLTFTDISNSSGFFQDSGFPVDMDNNGWTDIIKGDWNTNVISLQMNAGGVFTYHTTIAPVDFAGESHELTFFDHDQDGAVDILCAATVNGQTHLMVGLNDICTVDPANSFQTWESIAGPFQEQLWPSVLDFDNDGDLDLLVVHVTNISAPGPGYHYQPLRIYRNQGGTFTDVTVGSGLGSGHGLPTLWDYNNDGYLDLLFGDADCCDQPRMNQVYRNNGNGTFTDLGGSLGLRSGNTYYFPPEILDLENDGDEDVLWDIWSDSQNQQLYINSSGTFSTDQASSHGLGLSNENPFALDVDNDGDMDLICGSHGGSPDTPVLMVNPLLPNTAGSSHYLNIVLTGCASGHSALNALVRVYRSGAVLAKRTRPGQRLGYDPTAPNHFHFGLGTAVQADSVVVHWPSGAVTQLYDVPSGQVNIHENPDCVVMNCLTTTIPSSKGQTIATPHPNPTTGLARLANIPSDLTPKIFDATGRPVSTTFHHQGHDLVVDLSDHPAGLYIVRIGDRSWSLLRE